jgi:pimeloyl-ACP methyl ester carboxylesterase
MTVGNMRVETYGSGSPAMIFIPGLACGSWVWDDAVRTYAKTHAVYVVTLAGFDGLPAPGGSALDNADAALLKLITDDRIDRPVIVGHSLGGFLALRFGTEHSDLVRGIVSVDGTPVFPTLARSSPDERRTAADRIGAMIANESAMEFASSQQSILATMVTDPAKAAQIAVLTGKSSPTATGTYARELYAADLRPQLTKLTAPTLEIAPVPTKPAPYEGPQAASASMADREAGYAGFYQSLFPGAPNLTVVPIPNSLHFVMIDQPQALDHAIDAFLAELPTDERLDRR